MANLRDIFSKARRAASDLVRGVPQGLSSGACQPFDSAGLVVRCHTRWPPELMADWNALSLQTTAMQSPAWQAATFDVSGATELRLITVHDSQLLAVIPMQLSPAGGLGTIGPWLTDYLDPLVQADAADRVWPALMAFIESNWDRRINEIAFHNLREHAGARFALANAGGFVMEETIVDQAPAIALPATWDEFLQSLDAHERKETRRKVKKAEEKGGATLVRATAIDATEAIETTLRLMELAGGDKATAVQKTLRPLLSRVGPVLIAAGRLDVLTLHVEQTPAASLVQFSSPAGPMLYNAGHDPALREWSPGAVALALAIRAAIARGEKTYDLLRGREPYKYRLGAVDRPLYRITLRKKA